MILSSYKDAGAILLQRLEPGENGQITCFGIIRTNKVIGLRGDAPEFSREFDGVGIGFVFRRNDNTDPDLLAALRGQRKSGGDVDIPGESLDGIVDIAREYDGLFSDL